MNELEKYELEAFKEIEEPLGIEEIQEVERFVVDDLEKANWTFRKLRSFKKRVAEKEKLAKSEIERINAWLEDETKSDNESIAYFEQLLIDYYQMQKEHDEKFKLTTPYGKLSSRKRQPKVTVKSEDLAIDYLSKKNPKLITTVQKYSKNDLKSMFDIVEIDGELIAVDEDGEQLTFVELEAQQDSYTIKIEER